MELSKRDFGSIFFSVTSLIFAISVFLIPEQKIIILILLFLSILFAIIFSYINKINYNEKILKKIGRDLRNLSEDTKEKFNYLKEIYNLKVEVEMLKKKNKRGQSIDLMTILKIIIAIIFLYVIINILKPLF